MKKFLKTIRKNLTTPVIGLLFVLSSLFAVLPITPVYAVPDNPNTSLESPESTSENTPENTEETGETEENPENPSETTANTEEEEEENTTTPCNQAVGSMSWFVCPIMKIIGGAIDAVYGMVNDFLEVEPISTDAESPIYVVWKYMRDISNIVFIIMLLVVIYSQLTGLGMDNYGIKKVLPRIIIAAVLVNLSYIICSVAVDISNILGASLRGFFDTIRETAIQGTGQDEPLSISQIIGFYVGGGATVAAVGAGALIAVELAGGSIATFWILLPIIVGAFISILTAFIMLAARQALISILIMISPLAVIAYLLPNTEKWFTKWRDALTQMLLFFPMFSVLFGASNLAGWVLINSANNFLGVLLGIAVQTLPLFFAFSMMKMSNTILGKLSSALDKASQPAKSKIGDFSRGYRDLARARHDAKNLQKPLSWRPNTWRAAMLRRQDKLKDETRKAESSRDSTLSVERYNRNRGYGTRWDKDGNYSTYKLQPNRFQRRMNELTGGKTPTTHNAAMEAEARARMLKMREQTSEKQLENAMGNLNEYLDHEGMNTDELRKINQQKTRAYEDYDAALNAERQNNVALKRWLAERKKEVIDAQNASGLPDGQYTADYQRLIVDAAGVDGWDSDMKIRSNALNSVGAIADDALMKEREENIKRYTTSMGQKITADVKSNYNQALHSGNIEAVLAAQNILAQRGDYDVIMHYLTHYFDHSKDDDKDIDFTNLSEDTLLGDDFANSIALNLLGMKKEAPVLGQIGKAINMATAQWSNVDANGNRERQDRRFTMGELFTGMTSSHENIDNKYLITTLMAGRSIKDIDRTGFKALEYAIDTYSSQKPELFSEITNEFLPQIISGLPTFESGGEQIRNTLDFFVGVKYNTKTHQWEQKKGKMPNMDMIKSYLGGLTDKDIVTFKTDAYQAIISAIAIEENRYNDIWEKGPNGTFKLKAPSALPRPIIEKFQQSFNQGARGEVLAKDRRHLVNGMKVTIKDALKIDPKTLNP